MQSAADRDDWVEIVWDKISDNHTHNFNKYGTNIITNFDVSYDYNSSMHYSRKAFSIDGSDTIIPLQDSPDNPAVLGQRDGLSKKDIEKIEKMYCERPHANKAEKWLYSSLSRLFG